MHTCCYWKFFTMSFRLCLVALRRLLSWFGDQFPKVISGYVMFQIQEKLVEEAPACTRGPGVLSSACAGTASLSQGWLPVVSGSLVLFWPWEPSHLFSCSCQVVWSQGLSDFWGCRRPGCILYMHSFHHRLVSSILKQKALSFCDCLFPFLSIFTPVPSDRLQFKRSTQSQFSLGSYVVPSWVPVTLHYC